MQLGLALDQLAGAVCVFDRMAVLLSIAAPSQDARHACGPLAPVSAAALVGNAAILDDSLPAIEFAPDLAPTPLWADRLLARPCGADTRSSPRHAAITATGTDSLMAALLPRPVQKDAFGQLCQIGPSEAPSTFVAVRDQVLGADSTPLRALDQRSHHTWRRREKRG